jgi:UDP-N-acetylmuramate dehydrogenase
MNWWKNLKGRVSFGEPLKKHTTFKIGGPVKYFIEPQDTADLKLLLESVKGRKLSVFVIGAGSNILVNDKGLNALVIKLDSPCFKKIDFRAKGLTIGAGCMLGRVISLSKNKCVSAFELFAGIPGTIGGALAMNAGVREKNIGDLVEEIQVMDYNGKIKGLKRKDIKFNYRSSSLEKYIVLSACFRSSRKKKQELEAVVRERLSWRREKQELSLPSAGCVFKNPSKGLSAGMLIDLCGLKGKRIGDACICPRHANFIVNMGKANARDVLMLMRLATAKVKNKFNIDLQPEIRIWQ